MKSNAIHLDIPIIQMKEGNVFIFYSPALDLTAHGDSFEDAEKSFTTSLELFMDYVTERGTLEEVLKEYGWHKVRREWKPPVIIGQEHRTIEVPA